MAIVPSGGAVMIACARAGNSAPGAKHEVLTVTENLIEGIVGHENVADGIFRRDRGFVAGDRCGESRATGARKGNMRPSGKRIGSKKMST